MATHSSVLAWRSPGTGEPGGLPSMGSHSVGHDWSDLAAAAVCCLLVKVWLCFGFIFPKRLSGAFAFDNWATETHLCLEFISPLPAPGHFLRRIMLISVINRNPALWFELPVNTGENVVVTENVHRVAALFRPTFGSWGNKNLRESLLLGQWNWEKCAWANQKGLESQ